MHSKQLTLCAKLLCLLVLMISIKVKVKSDIGRASNQIVVI